MTIHSSQHTRPCSPHADSHPPQHGFPPSLPPVSIPGISHFILEASQAKLWVIFGPHSPHSTPAGEEALLPALWSLPRAGSLLTPALCLS